MLTKEQLLTKFGLSAKEARVYMASVSLGPAVAVSVATKASVNRGTVYDILKSLVNKGLMSSYSQGGKVIFAPEDSQALINITANEENSLREQEYIADELIPQLQSINRGNKNHPRVHFYDGKEGILEMIEDFLAVKLDKENLGISSVDKVYQLFPDFDELYRKRRKHKGIKSRCISSDGKKALKITTGSKNAKILPINEPELKSDINVYGEKVSFISLEKAAPLGVVIEGTGFTDTMRQFFQLAWEGLDK